MNRHQPAISAKKAFPAALLALILGLTLLVYFNTRAFDFVNYDDPRYVYENDRVKNDFPGLSFFLPERPADLYIPLTFLSLHIDWVIGKGDPGVFHLTNVALHLLNTALLFWIVWLLSYNRFYSFLTAGLFALHPQHVESVAWVFERKDVLFTFFYFIAFLCYHFFTTGKNARLYYTLALLAFILSGMSKPMAVSLPLVLIIYDVFYGNRKLKNAVLRLLPFFLVSAVFVLFTLYALDTGLKSAAPNHYSSFQKLLVPFYGLFFYAYTFFAPAQLSVIYPYPALSQGMLPILYYIAPVIVVGLFFWLVCSRWANAATRAGFLFYVCTLLPVLQIVPNASSVVADRYSYLPHVTLAFLVAHCIYRYLPRFKYWVAGTLLFILSALCYQRLHVWKNSETLFTDVIRHYPDVALAYTNRGEYYLEKNNATAALNDLTVAVQLDPKQAEAWNNLGWALVLNNRPAEALPCFKRSLEQEPNAFKTINNYANTLGALGLYEQALQQFEQALRLKPNDAVVLYNTAYTYEKMNNPEMAALYYKRSASLGNEAAKNRLQSLN